MCNRHELTVTIDCPYSGTIVPLRYLGVEPAVSSIMIEVNRRLYLEPESERAVRIATFPAVARLCKYPAFQAAGPSRKPRQLGGLRT